MKNLIIVSLALLVAGAVSVRATDAKENWDKHCAKCHGRDGKGKTEMGKKLEIKDYTDAKVQEGMGNMKMFAAIRNGIKDGEKTRMKGYGDTLSPDEIRALIQYIRGFKQ